nr:AsmA family protein [Rhodospirillales bacterium]
MRLLRFLAVLLILLVAALAATAWWVPPHLDLDGWRDRIATAASARLGREVRIDGPIAFRLLPQPMLTARRISLGSTGAAISVTAAELRLRLALGPLFEGRVDARELVLRGAELRLPWPLGAAAFRLRAPRWLSAFSARIEDGRLLIGRVAVTGIDATLVSDADTGTYAAAGTARFSGAAWRFTARLGQPGSDGSAGLDVTLDGQGKVQGVGGTLSGQFAPDGTFGGRVAARGPDLAQLLPAPAVPFRAEGRVTVAGGLAAADDLALQIGGSPARGAVALRGT